MTMEEEKTMVNGVKNTLSYVIVLLRVSFLLVGNEPQFTLVNKTPLQGILVQCCMDTGQALGSQEATSSFNQMHAKGWWKMCSWYPPKRKNHALELSSQGSSAVIKME